MQIAPSRSLSARTLTLLVAGVLLVVLAPAASAQSESECLYDPELASETTTSSGEGLEAGGLIWRVSYQTQEITALDPDTLETTITKSLGTTSAIVVSPISVVEDLIAIPISGAGDGAVQFIDAATGSSVALIEAGHSVDPDRFVLVSTVATIGDRAYVAAGDEIVVVDVGTITSGDAAIDRTAAIVDRIPTNTTVADLQVIDDTVVVRELFSSDYWAVTEAGLEEFDHEGMPTLSVEVPGATYAVDDGALLRTAVVDEAEPIEPISVAIAVPGEPTALAAVASTVFVATFDGVSGRVWTIDPQSGSPRAFVDVEERVLRLWSASDTLFIETSSDARGVALNGCAA